MECYATRSAFYVPKRKQPIGYLYRREGPGRALAVVGHYETACGGTDTINGLDEIDRLVRLSHNSGHDVLFEGLLISSEVARAIALWNDTKELLVVALDTPLDQCLASVNARRDAGHQERLARVEAQNAERREWKKKELPLPEPKGGVNPKNTTSKHRAVELSMARLQEGGVPALWLSRDGAFNEIKRRLGL